MCNKNKSGGGGGGGGVDIWLLIDFHTSFKKGHPNYSNVMEPTQKS